MIDWRLFSFFIFAVKVCTGSSGIFGPYKTTCPELPKSRDLPIADAIYECDKGSDLTSHCYYKCRHVSFKESATSYFECQAHFDPNTGIVEDANWYGLEGYCEPISCHEMTELSTAPYSCDKSTISNVDGLVVGYPVETICDTPCPDDLSTSNRFKCTSVGGYGGDKVMGGKAIWIPMKKTCYPSSCPDPHGIVSTALFTGNDRYNLASYVKHSCKSGYRKSSIYIPMCSYQRDGTLGWSPPLPTCLRSPYKCKFYGNRIGLMQLWHSLLWSIGSELTFSCYEATTLIGPTLMTCVDTGTKAAWRPNDPQYEDEELPKCIPATCPDLNNFKYGELDSCRGGSSKFQVDSLCRYFCPDGRTAPSTSRTSLLCTPNPGQELSFDGKWSLISDPCEVMTCPAITKSSLPSRLQMKCQGNTFGSQCYFSCDVGYDLNTDEHWITCDDVRKSAQWDKKTPSCIPTPAPSDPYTNRIPILTGEGFSKKYLIFKDRLTWHEANDYCEGIFGNLAIPKSNAIHDWIFMKMQSVMTDLKAAEGTWVGMSDIGSEGRWTFVDSTRVNPPFTLPDMTDGGRMKNYFTNVTHEGRYWFAWRFTQFCTYADCQANCRAVSARLPHIESLDVNNLIGTMVKNFISHFENMGYGMNRPYDYSKYYLDGTATSKSTFSRSDGKQLYFYPSWYSSNGISQPAKSNAYAAFQNWDQATLQPNGFASGKRCGVMNGKMKWEDSSCDLKLPLICETKTVSPFERWLSSGTPHQEPNNLWNVENCGGILNEIGAWNDFDCARKLPFICEVDVYCPRIPVTSLSKETTFTCQVSPTSKKPECNFQCSLGFELDRLNTTSGTIVCEDENGDRNGVWKPGVVNCVKIRIWCKLYTAAMLNSETTLRCSDDNRYGSQCNITCSDITTPRNKIDRVKCEDPDKNRVGDWSNDFPDCVDIVCPDISKTLKSPTKSTCTNKNIIHSRCTIFCTKGFALDSGDLTTGLHCHDNDRDGVGSWNATPPACRALTCTPIDPSSFSDATSISCTSKTAFNATCTFTCSGDTRVAGDKDVHVCTDVEDDKVTEWFPEPMSCIYFPVECTSYRGDHPLQCLNKIWTKAGCLLKGSGAPGTFTKSGRKTMRFTPLDDLLDVFKTYVTKSEDNDATAQMQCYGFEFLPGCETYHGPHSTECLESIWKEVGCLDRGQKHPKKLSSSELNSLKAMNLSHVTTLFNETALKSDRGDQLSQMHCYGIVYLPGCVHYRGPHPLECLISLWTQATCLAEGTKHPSKLSTKERNDLSSSDLWTLSIQFNNSASEANNGHVSHQVQCYGLEFPDQCEKYYGPHSTECLETIWASAKCLVSGRRHPTKLSAADHTRIDKLNLRQVMNETGTTRGASDLGNKKSQVDCFGLVYPDKCTNYYGPHPVECLVTMWLSATCVLQGYKYPEKLSTARLKELDSWNLRQISGYFNGTALSADSGSLINQTYCYGMEYPSKCVKYYGPHSLECLKTLWDYAHCTPDGKSYPAKISTAERSRLELMDIRQIISEFNGTKTSADSGVAASQMSCFGLEYPGGCDTYYGAYSETCLLTLWDSVGCVADGTEYPSKLAKSAIDSFTGLGLRLLVSLFNKSAISADMGDVSHQKKCFGMVYPDGCNNYYGPHSVTCLETIWKSVDCLYEGTRYPSKLGSAEYARINALNLRQVIGETNTTRRLSDNGDSESQMECFGLVYPKGCIKYYGSHPIDCLVTMWTTATCVSQGYKYPRKLSNSRLKELDTWDIRKISAFFNTTALSADSGSLVSQTYCFGMEYPTHCTKYYGPHPLECLETLWDYAHCIPEGNAYPTKIPSTELTRHDSMNLREIINEFNGTKSSADSGNRTSQLRCFGLEYPPGCDTYYGGYSNPCLITLWDSVRCLPEGTEYPLKPKAIDAFTGMGLRPVIALFNNSAVSADDGDVSHQMKCFGMEYPDDCKKYYGPHPSTCLETIWNTAGCLPEGLRFPSKLDSTEHARIDNLNLRQVIGETNTTRRLSDSGNSRSQMECFGLVYPEDCVKYYGPHPVDCLVTIWTTATCVSQGYKYPRKLSNSRLKELDTWNIRQISASFNATALSADSGSLVSQTYCFGMEYPTHCTKYYGPHPLKCLETLWDYAHCIPEGNAYPTKIPSGELTRHDSMNLREIINEFNSTKSSADSGNRTSQLRCFGLEYPSGCETYYGAYSIPCLITLWESVGCVPEGTKYPPKLTPTSVNVFTEHWVIFSIILRMRPTTEM